MNTDDKKCTLVGKQFFIFLSCWSIFGVLALMHSLARLRTAKAQEVSDRMVSLTVAIVCGPLYWIYFWYA